MLLKSTKTYAITILQLCTLITTTKSICIDSYSTICETVFDVTKSGRKHWTNLLIHTSHCALPNDREILRGSVLEKCPNLEELIIVDRLNQIDLNAFQMLSNLAYLNLYKNNLTIISVHMFANLKNVYKIELKGNNIEKIEVGAFNIARLATLNLGENKLSEVSQGIYNFKSLKKLLLAGNKINTIAPNSFNSNLETLDLSSNHLKSLEDKTFSNLNKLTELSLSRNQLKKIQKDLFVGLGDIFKLDLSHNEIDTIEVKSFDDLRDMKLLQLAHNSLKSLKHDIFPKNNAMTLQSIRLDHNTLSFLSSAIFNRLPALRRISLGGNPWQCFCLQEIQREMNLRNINYTPCDYQHYFTGKNPTCMQYKTDKCVEESLGDEFTKLYRVELQNFSYDCP